MIRNVLFTSLLFFSFCQYKAQSQIYVDAFSGSKGQNAEFFFLSTVDEKQ